jgi:hypothetical protein
MSEWNDDYIALKNGGADDVVIAEEAASRRQALLDGGADKATIDEYFGTSEPDMAPVRDLIQTNLQAASTAEPEKEHDFIDKLSNAFFSGLDNSSSYQMVQAYRGKSVTPDEVLNEDANAFYRTLSAATTVVGDLPAMIAGGFLGQMGGGAIGAKFGPTGAAIGQTLGRNAGANALPEAIRSVLANYYEKGSIKDFPDFWARTSGVFIDTTKSAIVGAVAGAAGEKVLGTLGTAGATRMAVAAAAPLTKRIAATGTEVATMVAIGKAFEGEVPSFQDFMDAALVVGGMHVSGKASSKLMKVWAKHGTHPADIAKEAEINPVLKQELLTDSDGVPSMGIEGGETIPKPKTLIPEKPVETPEVAKTPEVLAQEKILSRVGEAAETSKKFSVKETWNDFYKNFVDRLDPILRAQKELGFKESDLNSDKNPYQLARMVNDSKAKVLHFFEKGTIDFATNAVNGKGLKEIVKPFKDDIGGFKSFLISKRVLELEGRGIKHGFDLDAAKEVVSSGKEKYSQAASDVVDFQNNVLKYAKDSGLISASDFAKIKEANQNYVSFKRVSEEGKVSGSSKKGKVVKSIKGSELQIQDPFTSMLDNTEMILERAERNRAVEALVKLADETPGQELITKKATPMKAIELSAKELEKAGAESDGLTIFRGQERTLGDNEFEVFRNGKRQIYEADPDVAQAIKSLEGDPVSQNIFFKVANKITQIKRLGISLTPDFAVKNWFRDQATAGVFSSKEGHNPFKSAFETFAAMGDIWSKNDNYYNWLKSGGANGAFLELSKEIDFGFPRNKVETGVLGSTWNGVVNVKDFLHVKGKLLGTLAEQSTRLAEFKRVSEGATSGAKVFKGGFASREVTLDFQRAGAKAQAMNMVTAFFNANIQGTDKTVRAFAKDWKGATARSAALITLPSFLLWWANKDDKRVQDLPRWQRDNFWIIATDSWEKESVAGEADALPEHLVKFANDGTRLINKGNIYRLPKPEIIGKVFGTGFERVLDAWVKEDPGAAENIGQMIVGQITPNFIPDIVAPVAEQWANKSFFTEGKIVPGHLEGKLPELQYTDYTSSGAKALGKLIRWVGRDQEIALSSPVVLENYIRSWGGAIGQYSLQLADSVLRGTGIVKEPERPAATLSDMPIIKAFIVRYPSSGTESLTRFQEKAESNKKIFDSITHAAKINRPDLVEYYTDVFQDRMLKLDTMNQAIKNQGALIQKIYNSDMDPQEKRQQIDSIYFGMSEIARQGLETAEAFEKEIKKVKGEN